MNVRFRHETHNSRRNNSTTTRSFGESPISTRLSSLGLSVRARHRRNAAKSPDKDFRVMAETSFRNKVSRRSNSVSRERSTTGNVVTIAEAELLSVSSYSRLCPRECVHTCVDLLCAPINRHEQVFPPHSRARTYANTHGHGQRVRWLCVGRGP